jgi:signal transduction histidine kinase
LLPLLEECNQIMQAKAEEDSITVEINIPADFPQVEADRDKFKQVVLNLLSNAIKYNRPNGSVFLTGLMGERDWTLSIRDTGMGIPEKAQPHLFQKFYRVRASENKVTGTGLGLSICKQIVSGHGGSIELESKLGVGTTFIIHMPKGQ